jgi:putative two-component system response regulator
MTELRIDAERKNILVVDDSSDDVAFMSSLLKDLYKTKIATNADKAIQIAFSENPPDLILIDNIMSGMVGYELCRHFKKSPETEDIPIIFLGSKAEIDNENMVLELGAVDFIPKPLNAPIFLARIKMHLKLKNDRDILKNKTEYLEKELGKRTKEMTKVQDVTLVALGSIAETRDIETSNHIRRIQNYVKLLATTLKNHLRFKDSLSDNFIAMLFKSAPLHDIGKVGIPDYILLKPGQLTTDEFEIMKTHTTIGRNAILAAEKHLGTPASFLNVAREIAYAHHEKWNGKGYPEGLSGDDIPIPGRIMAVADVYDALISRLVYKPPYPHEESVDIIREASGVHFDPDIVSAFLELANQFNDVAKKYADSEEDVAKKWELRFI